MHIAISDHFAQQSSMPFSSAQFPAVVPQSPAQIVASWRNLFRRDGETIEVVDGAIVLSHGMDCRTVLEYIKA